jgi:hypothetical protein
LNYRYVPEGDGALKAFLARHPAAGIDEIRRAHPELRSVSMDHLSLKIAQLVRRSGLPV